MLSLFKPTWVVKDVFQISPEKLKKQGIKVIFSDLDNTLIPWNNPTADQELADWLKALDKLSIKLIVVSNNSSQRLEKALKDLNIPFIARALKPLPTGLEKALAQFDLKKEEVVMVGDQLLTDILAANLVGIRSILVEPLVQSDAFGTRINRFFEAIILKMLKKKYPKFAEEGKIINGK